MKRKFDELDAPMNAQERFLHAIVMRLDALLEEKEQKQEPKEEVKQEEVKEPVKATRKATPKKRG